MMWRYLELWLEKIFLLNMLLVHRNWLIIGRIILILKRSLTTSPGVQQDKG